MIRRHTYQGCVLFRRAGEFHRTEYVAHQVFVTQYGGLRLSRRAAGKQQYRHLIRIHRPFAINRRDMLSGVQKSVRRYRMNAIKSAKGIHSVAGGYQVRRRDTFEQGLNFFIRQSVVQWHVGHASPSTANRPKGVPRLLTSSLAMRLAPCARMDPARNREASKSSL